MSHITDNIKAGLKGIRGAGDVLRGEVMDGTDKVFDNQRHPTTQQRESKNHNIAEQGRQDVRNADEVFAKHEWERKGVHHEPHPTGTDVNTRVSGTSTTAPIPAHNVETTSATHGQPTEATHGHQSAPVYHQ